MPILIKYKNSNKTKIYGLIGFPLSHTFSPVYFKDKFLKEGILNTRYQAFEIENVSAFLALLEQGVLGLNVTIPFKEKVIQYLDEIEESAQIIGAVNTIKNVEGRLIGYNTDVFGFEESLKPLLNKKMKKQAIIFGSGGASKAVQFVLKKLDFKYRVVSRSRGDLMYDELTEIVFNNTSIIINTTPLGTFPKVDQCPDIPYEFLNASHLVYDLIYNPKKTLFLSNAEAQGATIKNGYQMLELQAEKSWHIWNTNYE